MKKFRKSAVTAVKISSAAFFALFCLASTDSVKAAVESSLTRCLTVVVPSLYAMMIVSGFLVRSGIIEKLSAPLSKAGRFLFGMDGCIFPIFLFSMFAGYPVGAKIVTDLRNRNLCSKDEGERMLAFTNNSGIPSSPRYSKYFLAAFLV